MASSWLDSCCGDVAKTLRDESLLEEEEEEGSTESSEGSSRQGFSSHGNTVVRWKGEDASPPTLRLSESSSEDPRALVEALENDLEEMECLQQPAVDVIGAFKFFIGDFVSFLLAAIWLAYCLFPSIFLFSLNSWIPLSWRFYRLPLRLDTVLPDYFYTLLAGIVLGWRATLSWNSYQNLVNAVYSNRLHCQLLKKSCDKTKIDLKRLKVEFKPSSSTTTTPLPDRFHTSVKVHLPNRTQHDALSSPPTEPPSPVSYAEHLQNIPSQTTPMPLSTTWPKENGSVYLRMIEDPTVLSEEINTNSLLKRGWPLHYPPSPLRMNGDDDKDSTIVHEFCSPLFKGRILFRVAGVPSANRISYFTGKKRVTQVVVQGQFRESVGFHEALTGFLLRKPLLNLPVGLLTSLGLYVVRTLNPVMIEDVKSETPYILSPIVASSQTLHVANTWKDDSNISRYGDARNIIEAPDILNFVIPENTALLGGRFATDSKLSTTPSQRKSFFSNKKHLTSFEFDPNLIYTFEIYQHLFNFSTYLYDITVTNLDICKFLGTQVAEVNCLVDSKFSRQFLTDGESARSDEDEVSKRRYLWRVEVWNKRLTNK